MDSAHFKQLERCFQLASRYMGSTWRRTMLDSLAALDGELKSLSELAANNLESAVNAESQLAAMRRELENAKTVEVPVEVVVEKIIETPGAIVTETVTAEVVESPASE